MPHPHMARANASVLVVVDVQEPLARGMPDRPALVKNINTLIQIARINDVPVLVTEQNSQRLGPTVPEVSSVLSELGLYKPMDKLAFSCCAVEGFVQQIHDMGRDTLVLTGIEAHVCIAQTALEALTLGYKVHVVKDAVASHQPSNHQAAMEKLVHAGAVISTTEMVAYEFLGRAGPPQFKQAMQHLRWEGPAG